MNEPQQGDDQDDKGSESDFSEYAGARPGATQRSSGGSFLRGCGIALGIGFLIFAFVVGACFMSM
jgi:hypothetical protein